MTSTTQKKIILKRCGSCSDFASLTLAFALQLRKSTEKPQSVPYVTTFRRSGGSASEEAMRAREKHRHYFENVGSVGAEPCPR